MRRAVVRRLILLGILIVLALPLGVGAQQDAPIGLEELDGLPEQILVTVAVGRNNALALYNWRDGTVAELIYSQSDDSHGTWSPDGNQIAFQTIRDGDWEVYLYDFATETERNLTQSHASSDMYPNWSPDGQVVHFSDRSGQAALWLTNPADGVSVGLTTEDGCVPDYHPNFAPDGSAIAYRADCAGSGDIWWRDMTVVERVNLTADSAATDRYPAWSPNGSQILFVSNRDGNEEVYVMDSDGSNVRNLTNHPARDSQGSWSPDGRFIIFISDRNGTSDLWIMEADGERATLLLGPTEGQFDGYNWPWWEPMMDEEQAIGGNADVEFVQAVYLGDNTWRFHVTVRHPDTGWDDYADGWDVVLPGGTVILPDSSSSFTRLLLHPHENEQPFTRSQSGIVIPEGVTTVTVRAHDIVDGWGGRTVTVDLTQTEGEGYEVVR